ncbi:IclR family transcriptional regulator [Halobellus salinisoli]|uniref:IclR family transcriptional regulator n=1 Tax=Halobellus salinisoli TaxID=3108500 RepID=UPI003009F3B8
MSGQIKSYNTMGSIIRLIESDPGITLSDIAGSLGVSKSTVHRHLTTLTEQGFVTKQENGYWLGLGLLELGEKARLQRPIYKVAKTKLDETARETGENIWLSVEENGEIVYIYRVSGEHHIETYASIGYRSKPNLLAAGKVILAYMDEVRAEEIISSLTMSARTEHTITDETELREQLQFAREEGVAYNFQEAAEDINALAAPIFKPTGGIYGSVTIFGPANRLTEQKLKTEYKDLTLQVAEEIKLRAQYG